MRGVWLTQAECIRLLKIKSQVAFQKGLGKQLKSKLVKSRQKFFVTEEMIPEDVRVGYEDALKEYDDDSLQVESIIGDVSADSMDELTAARLDNIKARTSLINQKLEEQKERLWTEWNEEFFEVFVEAFAKFKNDLISLHLGEEQLNILNDKLELALKSMKDKLDGMWMRFKNQSDETENEQ